MKAQVSRLVHLILIGSFNRAKLSDQLFNAVMWRCVSKIFGSTDTAALEKLRGIVMDKAMPRDRRIMEWIESNLTEIT